MMERYSGDFLAAVDGLRALLGCRGTSGRSASSAPASAPNTATATQTRGEVEVDRGQSSGQFVRRIWLEPAVADSSGRRRGHPRASTRSSSARAASTRA